MAQEQFYEETISRKENRNGSEERYEKKVYLYERIPDKLIVRQSYVIESFRNPSSNSERVLKEWEIQRSQLPPEAAEKFDILIRLAVNP